MQNYFSIAFGKSFIFFSKLFNLGNGSTWPGHIALNSNPHFLKNVLRKSKTKVVVIAGTNGKTTTGKLITEILRGQGKSVIENAAGANLLNGLASTLIRGASLNGKLNQDYLVFESDENALPQIIEQTDPDYVICLNLFRDQLDRYGEIDSIAKKWRTSFENLNSKTTLILNADDPQIAYLSHKTKAKALYFGLEEKGSSETKHGADSIFCPKCSNKLDFKEISFSHLGNWSCPNCKLRRPEIDLSSLDNYPIPGTYNKYNLLSAALFANSEGISLIDVNEALKSFKPAFGRQEKIFYNGRKIQLFLSKNPTSFNESLQTIKDLDGSSLLIVLNDKIPDGLDVSWIWDIDFEDVLSKDMNIAVSGDRVYDMALRLKYSEQFTHVEPDLARAIDKMTKSLEENETLFMLPNYSAMLDVRKILTGRRIL